MKITAGKHTLYAKKAAPLSEIFNPDNCDIVFLADGPVKSWSPHHNANAITDIEPGKKYIVHTKQDMNFNDLFTKQRPK